ncbi:hypothetical protein BT96DRAFT_518374 [Gymnopus androsaceus JB14]|uniref:F-box domain-containing protein n=1 Tax=Gymnopus androsaceus JB14 TaxID=1447944 RepID=A0A6A4I188_9AGAR|nr:hypothetical protein BT96DRAFT_518374 [Gymnopus androsaceus JB14]
MSDDATSQLPAEILACIFDHASDWNLLQKWNPDDIGYCDPDSLPTELTYPVIGYLPALSLGATCSKWRAIAISYPDIWSRLKLEISVGKAKPDQEFIAMLELFLSRSGQQPLVIDLNIQGQESQSNFVNLVIDLLRRHSSRWKEFRFRGDSFTRDRKLARPILSMLETLSLQWDWTEDADILYLQSAPKLRRISSGMLSFYVIKFMVSPEFWERIVSLDVMISGSFSLKNCCRFPS